jgi:undecaprenyl-diphosphatase
MLGISRPAGAEFTFFLAIPVMAGASFLKTLKFFLDFGAFTLPEFGYLFIGTVTAFIVSLFTVKFLMDFVKKHDFKIFGWYRIVLGFVVLLVTLLPLLLT